MNSKYLASCGLLFEQPQVGEVQHNSDWTDKLTPSLSGVMNKGGCSHPKTTSVSQIPRHCGQTPFYKPLHHCEFHFPELSKQKSHTPVKRVHNKC